MADFAPSGRQLVLLARISANIALSLHALTSGDIETDLATSIDLIELAKGGLIRYSMGDQVVRCTGLGQLWVAGHEIHRVGETRRAGAGH